TRFSRDWSSDVCSSDLKRPLEPQKLISSFSELPEILKTDEILSFTLSSSFSICISNTAAGVSSMIPDSNVNSGKVKIPSDWIENCELEYIFSKTGVVTYTFAEW